MKDVVATERTHYYYYDTDTNQEIKVIAFRPADTISFWRVTLEDGTHKTIHYQRLKVRCLENKDI